MRFLATLLLDERNDEHLFKKRGPRYGERTQIA